MNSLDSNSIEYWRFTGEGILDNPEDAIKRVIVWEELEWLDTDFAREQSIISAENQQVSILGETLLKRCRWFDSTAHRIVLVSEMVARLLYPSLWQKDIAPVAYQRIQRMVRDRLWYGTVMLLPHNSWLFPVDAASRYEAALWMWKKDQLSSVWETYYHYSDINNQQAGLQLINFLTTHLVKGEIYYLSEMNFRWEYCNNGKGRPVSYDYLLYWRNQLSVTHNYILRDWNGKLMCTFSFMHSPRPKVPLIIAPLESVTSSMVTEAVMAK